MKKRKKEMIGNIAITGEMGSGKTSLANYICEEYGYKRFSFASEVKKICELITGRPIDKALDRTLIQNIGQILKKNITTIKNDFPLQWSELCFWNRNKAFSNYYRQNLNALHRPDCFVNLLFLNEEFKYYVEIGKVVIDDLRFVREELACNVKDFLIVKLDVPEVIRVNRLLERDGNFKPEWLTNESEAEISKINEDLLIKDMDFHKICVKINTKLLL